MAETPNIQITIDQEALRKQIEDAVEGGMRGAAMRLRQAADALDGGAFWREHDAHLDRMVEKARAEGRAEATSTERESGCD